MECKGRQLIDSRLAKIAHTIGTLPIDSMHPTHDNGGAVYLLRENGHYNSRG